MQESNLRPFPYEGTALPSELTRHIGGVERYRTSILRFFRPTLRPRKLLPHVVMPVGFEPTTSTLRGWRLNQFVDGTKLATMRGLEPPTSSVTGWRSTLLSYMAIWRSRRDLNPQALADRSLSKRVDYQLSHCCIWRCGSDSNRRITDLQSVPLDQSRAPHHIGGEGGSRTHKAVFAACLLSGQVEIAAFHPHHGEEGGTRTRRLGCYPGHPISSRAPYHSATSPN